MNRDCRISPRCPPILVNATAIAAAAAAAESRENITRAVFHQNVYFLHFVTITRELSEGVEQIHDVFVPTLSLHGQVSRAQRSAIQRREEEEEEEEEEGKKKRKEKEN
jgi:hypothetical protein